MFKIEEVTVVGSCVVSFLGTSDDELSEGGTLQKIEIVRKWKSILLGGRGRPPRWSQVEVGFARLEVE